MANFNRVILAGNLVKDPDLRYTPSGQAVASFDIAINSFFTDKAGKKQEDSTFVPITVWRKQAETSAQWLKKGKSVLIEGRLKQERWVNKQNEKRSRLIVVAQVVRFLSPMDKKDIQPDTETPADTGDEGQQQEEQ
ncbi:Single-stranded DNA-binding protein [subsurface metagenome]